MSKEAKTNAFNRFIEQEKKAKKQKKLDDFEQEVKEN